VKTFFGKARIARDIELFDFGQPAVDVAEARAFRLKLCFDPTDAKIVLEERQLMKQVFFQAVHESPLLKSIGVAAEN
jgi:hypothetical protein